MLASGAEKWKWFYLYYFVDIGSLFFFSLEKKASHKASTLTLIFIFQSLFDSPNQATQNPDPLLTLMVFLSI
ncbi:MAG: hypothetical protein ACJAT4_000221 [Granulosicoccus sp.]|jgi:hypothetical protein